MDTKILCKKVNAEFFWSSKTKKKLLSFFCFAFGLQFCYFLHVSFSLTFFFLFREKYFDEGFTIHMVLLCGTVSIVCSISLSF